jgi:hypothetical protein
VTVDRLSSSLFPSPFVRATPSKPSSYRLSEKRLIRVGNGWIDGRLDRPRKKRPGGQPARSVSYSLSAVVKICRQELTEILLSNRDWRSKAFYRQYDDSIIALTNARSQEMLPQRFSLAWHPLCSNQGVWLKAPRRSCWSKTTTRFESCSRCL